MARAFGAPRVSTADFQHGWRAAVQHGRDTLEAIRAITRPVDWLERLARDEGGEWTALCAEYRDIMAARRAHGERVRALNEAGAALLRRVRHARAEADALQKEKGRHFRNCIRTLRDRRGQAGEAEDAGWLEGALAEEMERREGISRTLADTHARAADLLAQHAALAERRRALTADPEEAARDDRRQAIETLGEREKALRVRDAWMTAEALTHTQPRPTAWWFPVVDPGGAWFSAVSETAEFHWQTLEVGR
jgi:hypothetical protein